MKRCGDCKETKPREAFNKRSAVKDGLQPICRDCQKARYSSFYDKNKEAQQERARSFYSKHKEHYASTMREWRQNNRERMRSHWAKRRLLKKLQRDETLVDYSTVLERDGYVCYLCEKCVEPDDVHMDHVIPLSKGGRHSIDNLRVTHSKCNLAKGVKSLDEYRRQQNRV